MRFSITIGYQKCFKIGQKKEPNYTGYSQIFILLGAIKMVGEKFPQNTVDENTKGIKTEVNTSNENIHGIVEETIKSISEKVTTFDEKGFPPPYEGGTVDTYMSLIETYVSENPENMATYIDSYGEYPEYPELNLKIRNYAFKVFGVLAEVERVKTAGYNIEISLNEGFDGREVYNIKNLVGTFFTDKLPNKWIKYGFSYDDPGFFFPISESGSLFIHSEAQLLNRIASFSPLLTKNMGNLNTYFVKRSEDDILNSHRGYYDGKENLFLSLVKYYAHEYVHHIDSSMGWADDGTISDEWQKKTQKWLIGGSSDIDRTSTNPNFISPYAEFGGYKEDWAETMGKLIEEYTDTMAKAKEDDKLMNKIQLIKRFLFVFSEGQMDDAYWAALEEGLVNIDYRTTKEKGAIENQNFYKYFDEFKNFFEDLDLFKELKTYPNPTTGEVNLSGIDYEDANLDFNLIMNGNVIGQQIKVNTSSKGDNFKVDLNGYPSGVYVIQAVSSTGKKYSAKVVKI